MARIRASRPRLLFLHAALVAVALARPVAGQDAPVPTVTLQEAISLALDRNPAAVAARGDVDAAEAGVLSARGAWLPTLDATSSFRNSSNERFDQATGRLVSESYTAGLQAGLDLFTGGRRLADHGAATARLRAAEAADRAARYETARVTTALFFETAAAEEVVAAAVQRLARARRQRDFAGTRLELGTATRSDLLRAELELGNAELALLEAETALRSARLRLGRQIGAAGAVEPADGALPEVAPVLPPLEDLVARAVARAPEVTAARAERDAAGAVRRASWSGYLPSLQAIGGYDWFSFDFPPDDRSWSFRVTASMPLFDGFDREAGLLRAAAAERTAAALARDAEIGVRVAVEDAVRRIEAAERRIAIAGRAIDLAREDLRVLEERYRIGSATILDLQTSQVALAEAEIDWALARQELGEAVADLEAVLGAPLAEMAG